jgi:hypothetical protein
LAWAPSNVLNVCFWRAASIARRADPWPSPRLTSCSAPVDVAVLAKLRRASELWAQGEKCLAQIHLEHLRLPKLESEEQAFRLFLADRLVASGHFSARSLPGLGLRPAGEFGKPPPTRTVRWLFQPGRSIAAPPFPSAGQSYDATGPLTAG